MSAVPSTHHHVSTAPARDVVGVLADLQSMVAMQGEFMLRLADRLDEQQQVNRVLLEELRDLRARTECTDDGWMDAEQAGAHLKYSVDWVNRHRRALGGAPGDARKKQPSYRFKKVLLDGYMDRQRAAVEAAEDAAANPGSSRRQTQARQRSEAELMAEMGLKPRLSIPGR